MIHKRLKQIFKNSGFTNIVTLGDWTDKINILLKVHVRTCADSNYDEITLSDINEDGSITITPTDVKPANESAIQRQRLHKGDLIFGHRGKLGKVGLVEEEPEKPLTGNHGMMRIHFKEDRSIETSRYVQDFLQSKLIRSYITAMMSNQQITVQLIKSLPIPHFDEMEGMSKFSIVKSKRQKLELEAKKIWEMCLSRREEALMLSSMSTEQLNVANEIDNHILTELESLSQKLKATMPSNNNVFLSYYSD